MTHEGSTARIALIISLALRYYKIAEPDIEAVLTGALTHDVSEVITGDFPGGFLKTKHPAFSEALADIEREAESGIYHDLPQPMAEYMRAAASRKDEKTVEAQIINYADKLDAFHFASAETALGNVMEEPSAPMQTTRAALAKLHYPWLVKLRERIEGFP